jgi:hypothetical protein
MQKIIDFFCQTLQERDNLQSNQVILQQKDAKNIFQEKLPIALLGIQFNMVFKNVEVDYLGSEGCVDAIFYFKDENKKYNVEVTSCKGKEDHLRAEKLVTNGYVPATGPIFRNKKSKEIITKLTATSNEEQIKNLSEVINQRIIDKISKNYPENTILLVSFNSVNIISIKCWESLTSKISIDKTTFYSIYLCNLHNAQIFQL